LASGYAGDHIALGTASVFWTPVSGILFAPK
jgi:hypothetical protein